MKRFTLIALVLTLLLSVFAACGETESIEGGTTTTTTTTNGATEPETNEVTEAQTTEDLMSDNLPEDLRFEGSEFVFATYGGGNIGNGWAYYLDVDEPEAGNLLEEASYNRNIEVETRLGLKVSCEEPWNWFGGNDGLVYALDVCSLGGQNTYDSLLLESYFTIESLIIDELITDIAALPYIDLTRGYYNRNANNTYYLKDNLYLVVSDLTYACQNANAWLVNDEMLVDLGYDADYLYKKVNEGTWTINVVFDMVEGLWVDVNSDSQQDVGDKFGIGGHPYSLCYLYTSSGQRGVYITDTGFENDYGTDRSLEVYNRVIDLWDNPNVYVKEWDTDIFHSGRALFTGWTSEIRALQSLPFEFGILPYPKYEETQDGYETGAGGGHLIVPGNIEDENMVGAVIEAMSSGSSKHFVPAFYDNFIEQGVIRNDYSRENWAKMLDEWGAYAFTGWITPHPNLQGYTVIFNHISTGSRDFKSAWDAQKEVIDVVCQQFFDYYLAD